MSATKVIVREDDLLKLEAEIQNRLGTTDALVFPDDYISGIQNMPDTLEMLVGGELKSYTDYRRKIPDHICQFNTGIENVNLPNAIEIGQAAFYRCSGLKTANLPCVTTMSYNIFYSCESLVSIDVPNVTCLYSSVFSGCKSLESINLPNLTFKLEDNNNNNGVFAGCSNLVNVNLPKIEILPNRTFYNCTSLKKIHLPLVTTVDFQAMYGCTNLEEVILPLVTEIGNNVVTNCPNLKAFVIRQQNSVCTLYDNSFPDETFIYVPDALVEDYKIATNWSIYTDRIKPLSEYVETE